MAAKPRPRDAGEQQIDNWQRWLVDANVQKMRDDGHDEAAIAHARVGLETLAANIAARMRDEYQLNRSRGVSP